MWRRGEKWISTTPSPVRRQSECIGGRPEEEEEEEEEEEGTVVVAVDDASRRDGRKGGETRRGDTCVGGFSVELPGVSPHRDLRIFPLSKKANKSRGRFPRNQEPSATGVRTTTWTHMQSRRSDLFLTAPRIEFSSCMVHAVRKRGQVHFSPSSSLSILFFTLYTQHASVKSPFLII